MKLKVFFHMPSIVINQNWSLTRSDRDFFILNVWDKKRIEWMKIQFVSNFKLHIHQSNDLNERHKSYLRDRKEREKTIAFSEVS